MSNLLLTSPPQSAICLCTQCRKQSGALAVHFHTVPLHSFAWTSAAPSNYEVVPGNHRWFCGACGSFLGWQGDAAAGEPHIEVCAGTVDEEFLVGRKGADGEVVRGSGCGELLCHAEGHLIWAQNEVGGATSGIGGGKRYKFGSSDGVLC